MLALRACGAACSLPCYGHMTTLHPSSERNMATGERVEKRREPLWTPELSIASRENPVRGMTDPPPNETEDGGEYILSGQSREEGGERDQ